ncbi:Formyltetrahydrofolate deformylase [Micractinium conductrix]|uniref:Formyltetrahydrofolate deformylase n=1 Tax=Micractinium conductrix TaxID=554055 RepID=A0A2P6VS75_9CHLO|nr:Formyltetrahydrofolate deformylase [Micractinium conductrix]|eukprot:PSC76946.1 Formyltetrahydrofolate deformylase [Micractinium conductrix]
MIGTLLIKCPDSKGVVASVAQLLFGFGCNIISSDQFSDIAADMFFQRVVFDYSDMLVGPGNTAVLERGITEVARKYSMDWRVSYSTKQKRMALLVSKLDHCLYDLLIRVENGEMENCTIPIILSNHPDLEVVAKRFNIPYRHLPITPKDAASKAAQEAAIEGILEEEGINLIVLARYMQIFSKDFCDRHWRHTINIHHSFLPAFEGARPYHRAHERGVKVIGATAHYATSDLDCGPIIAQDVTHVSHRDAVPDMVRKGRDLERTVLAKAVRWHLQDRIIVHDNRTVLFE